MSASYSARAHLSFNVLLATGIASCLLVGGCNAPRAKRSPPGAVTSAAPPKSTAKPVVTQRPKPQAPLEQFVQQQVEEAEAAGVRVVVYVGATWCEPCQHFHKALESGKLDAALAGTQFVEFDADRDRDELRAAGYASKYIPLFSVPDPDGRASNRRIEGSVKGADAVQKDLVPRLLAMLDQKPPG
jgi:thiol:disulfide interchange protein